MFAESGIGIDELMLQNEPGRVFDETSCLDEVYTL